jgi:acyl-CoA thioester hydrolase
MEVDFLAELYYGNPVEIRTWIARIGRSSVHVVQEVWQRGRPGARGLAVMVYCDPCTHKPQPVPDAVREALAEHLEVTQG